MTTPYKEGKLGLLTLPCLYILEVALYCRSKCVLIRGSDIHSYETRGRESYRAEQHRTVASERLPSQAGVKFLNQLPEGLIQSDNLNQFKALLKRLLVSNAFYSVEEFMAGCWEN
ncbi:hypothetical protein J6590_063122 [Homalodisca vitripennis]|nr:hypothetical protein J6590_063122 [Homalodisca vitripennis]